MPADPLASLRAYAFELAGMAKTGLEFASNDYDRDRFVRTLRIAESLTGMTFPDGIPQDVQYVSDLGVVTPKTGTAVAAFDAPGRILLMQRADNRRWALPGGYAEIGSTPAANALRELREETGFEGEVERLLGIFDSGAFQSPNPYQHYILLFRARLTGGAATTGVETAAVAFFARAELPEAISPTNRAMIEHAFSASSAPAYQ